MYLVLDRTRGSIRRDFRIMFSAVLLVAVLSNICEGTSVDLSDSNLQIWSHWSKCSTSCGEGQRWRQKRLKVTQSEINEVQTETKSCFLQFCPSYLSWPRIHFSGKMLADMNTANNFRCAYDNDKFSGFMLSKSYQKLRNKTTTHKYFEKYLANWNPDGSNQFYFVNTSVTSICAGPNNCSLTESIVGSKVTESDRGVMASIGPDWQKCEIWSLKVHIPGILKGDMLPNSRHTDAIRVDHIPSDLAYAYSGMTRFKSKLQNVTWYDEYYRNLFSNARELSMTFIYDLFNQKTMIGRISGTIGFTSPDDAIQVTTSRVMQSVGKTLAKNIRSAPFFVNFYEKTLTVDLGLSFKAKGDGSFTTEDVGNLDIALILTWEEYCKYFQPNANCFANGKKDELTWKWITQGGEVAQRITTDGNNWYMKYGGVMDFDLSHLEEKTLKLMKSRRIALIDGDGSVYLEEFPDGINIGLMGLTSLRLDPGESGTFYGFVSSFGRPVKNAQFTLHVMKNAVANAICWNNHCNRSLGIPYEAVDIRANNQPLLTNRSGLVRLDINAVSDPGNPRGCGIDGQLYPLQVFVRYTKGGKTLTFSDYDIVISDYAKKADYVTHDIPTAVKIYSYVPKKACPTWKDVRDIFIQYYNLYPVMWKVGIIDLHSYEDLRRKAKMLKVAMFDLDMTDSRYMPVSRDLSKGKKNLIYNWIKCGMKRDELDSNTKATAPNICSDYNIEKDMEEVRNLVHKAMMLELSTIPPYVNAWLSLKSELGRNKEIADILKSIFNEEMLHLSFGGNILNAIGGVVNMIDETELPSYPTILTSGDTYQVLPDVRIGLEAFSIGLVQDIFSKIEHPSSPHGKKIMYSLAEIWKALPSQTNVISKNMAKLFRENVDRENYKPSHLTNITRKYIVLDAKDIKSQRSDLQSWMKLSKFAYENLERVKSQIAATVGEFYSLIALKLTLLESCIQINNLESVTNSLENATLKEKTLFTGNAEHQIDMAQWFQQSEDAIFDVMETMHGDIPKNKIFETTNDKSSWRMIRPPLFKITDLKTALEAIVEISYQGEGGSGCSPFVPETTVYASQRGRDEGQELSHYYRFQEIVNGRKLVQVRKPSPCLRCLNITQPEICPFLARAHDEYCYAGEPITFYEEGVWPILSNPQKEDYKEGTKSSLLLDQFNLLYTRLLFCLQTTFSGDPNHIRKCMAIMYDLTLAGKKLVQTPLGVVDNTTKTEFGKTGIHGAPTWSFVRESDQLDGLPVRESRVRPPLPADKLVPPV